MVIQLESMLIYIPGVNAGVILMKLSMMRSANLTGQLVKLYEKYKSNITLGDNDLMNILYHNSPGKKTEPGKRALSPVPRSNVSVLLIILQLFD